MIRTLAFDLGNVLVNWKPEAYLMRTLGCDRTEAERIGSLVFGSKVWKDGDLGLYDRKQIGDLLSAEHPEDAAAIRAALSDCDSVLTEFDETTAMLEKLKTAGCEIYYISNTNPGAVEYMEKNCRFFRLFSGGIASFRDKVLKPSAEIYRLFLTRYGKKAEECLFVDDLAENIEGAAACGLIARQLHAPEQMREILCSFEELRCILEGNNVQI